MMERYDREFSGWLDGFRWVAAIAVLVAHTGGRMVVDVTSLPAAERNLGYVGF